MRLRNKKTGEIALFENAVDIHDRLVVSTKDGFKYYNSLGELNEEWEEGVPEEPKSMIKDVWFNSTLANGHFVEIDFISDEEAILAVRKLKAWKRLKDKGFKFQFWTSSYSGDNISFFIDWINADSKKEIEEDLDLLFGGEE